MLHEQPDYSSPPLTISIILVKKWLTVFWAIHKEREAVVSSFPISMHAAQILLLTKVLAKKDLAFYDFSTGKPADKWRAPE
jgi:hypothetical protein